MEEVRELYRALVLYICMYIARIVWVRVNERDGRRDYGPVGVFATRRIACIDQERSV